MLATQLNTACAAHQNINKVSLHTGDPGLTGANDSGATKQTITWSTPSGGWMKGTVTFTAVTGTFTHIGLWVNSTFITSERLGVTLPSSQTLSVLVECSVEEKP